MTMEVHIFSPGPAPDLRLCSLPTGFLFEFLDNEVCFSSGGLFRGISALGWQRRVHPLPPQTLGPSGVLTLAVAGHGLQQVRTGSQPAAAGRCSVAVTRGHEPAAGQIEAARRGPRRVSTQRQRAAPLERRAHLTELEIWPYEIQPPQDAGSGGVA